MPVLCFLPGFGPAWFTHFATWPPFLSKPCLLHSAGSAGALHVAQADFTLHPAQVLGLQVCPEPWLALSLEVLAAPCLVELDMLEVSLLPLLLLVFHKRIFNPLHTYLGSQSLLSFRAGFLVPLGLRQPRVLFSSMAAPCVLSSFAGSLSLGGPFFPAVTRAAFRIPGAHTAPSISLLPTPGVVCRELLKACVC